MAGNCGLVSVQNARSCQFDLLSANCFFALPSKPVPLFLTFAGVSCDACLKGNFRGRRFKCLICYDYDLCASCYESGATTTRHTTEHPMQCILTRVDYGEHHVQVTLRSGQPLDQQGRWPLIDRHFLSLSLHLQICIMEETRFL